MTTTVAFLNFKGGVGKTGNVVNLGACLAALHHKRVLVIDLDAQCNASLWLLGKAALRRHTEERQRTVTQAFRDKINGTRLFRLKDLQVMEGWINVDMMGMMQQMGVIPAPPAPDPSTFPPAKHVTGAPSTREANKALMRRFIEEVWNKGNLEVADELFHPDHTSPSAPGLPAGPEGTKMIATAFRNAFPDYHMTIEQMAAEDDRVAARFLQSGTHKGELWGIPPTGKFAKFSEIGILRIADGKIVESWYDVDMLGMMGQLGVGG